MISRITSVSLRSRGLLLLPVGAYVVHQLRYRIAYGPDAGQQLAAQGHSYLDSFAPWLVLLLCLATGSFLARTAQAFATGRTESRPRSFLALWSVTTVALVGIYAVQEFLEGLVAVGHPTGLAGVVGHGGWWAFVVSLVVGAAIALLLRVAGAVVRAAARAARRRTVFGLDAAPRIARVIPVRRRPLALARSVRGPPLLA